jgi:lipopolysaccharide export system protein LptC
MTLARLPTLPGAGPRRPRTLGAATRPPPTAAAMARRRLLVGLAKGLLPLVAVVLLATVALWPEFHRDVEQGRVAYRRGSLVPESGRLTDARYHGVDDHGRPYTITATVARQSSPERIDLTAPFGDVIEDGSTWLSVKARTGVFLQHAQQLDLSGEVTLYRDDGTTLTTDAAALDLKAGAAAGAAMTHVEGPFGTLDAQGFTATDGGTVIHFAGPGRLLLNGGAK